MIGDATCTVRVPVRWTDLSGADPEIHVVLDDGGVPGKYFWGSVRLERPDGTPVPLESYSDDHLVRRGRMAEVLDALHRVAARNRRMP